MDFGNYYLGRTLVYDFIILLLRPELTRVHKLFSWHTSKIRVYSEKLAYFRIYPKYFPTEVGPWGWLTWISVEVNQGI